jgi:hypothetical protein
MIETSHNVRLAPSRRRVRRAVSTRGRLHATALRYAKAFEPFVLGVIPVTLLIVFGWLARHSLALDLHHAFRPAAQAVLAGHSPYPPPTADAVATRAGFVYLPFASFLFVPFAFMPLPVAELVGTLLVVAAGATALWIVGVRDWRCYGIVLLFPPVLSAIQTANLTLPLMLALAVVWALRRRAITPGVILGLTLGTKLFLLPVVVWFLATRRYRAAASAFATTAFLIVGAWALIGFSGARDYPKLLRVLSSVLSTDSYTPFALSTDLGAPPPVARGVGLTLAIAALAACWLLGRRGDERRSFTFAVVAALLFTPIVWLHYFALLVVPIAIVHRRLSWLWAMPLLLWFFAEGFGNGTTVETALTLLTVTGVVGLTLRATERGESIRSVNAAVATTPL